MKMATREAYGKALAQLVLEKENVIVLDADLTKSTKTIDAKKARIEHHFNMGIAEGNMMAVAAGLAASNKVVYASSFAMFAAGRAFEQIRNSICYPNLNVKVCATHAGITVGEDGASHQCIEDLALMRSIPHMKVFQPCDQYETKALINYIYSQQGPCYVRLGRLSVEDVYDEKTVFDFTKGKIIQEGEKVVLIASGLMVQECLKACQYLSFQPTIVDICSIKPLDTNLIQSLALKYDTIISVEEHTIYGGLGCAIAECLAPLRNKAAHYMIGMKDEFGRSGKPDDLLRYYHLDAQSIAEFVKEHCYE